MSRRKGQAPKQPVVFVMSCSRDDDEDMIHALSAQEIIDLDPDAWGQDEHEAAS